MKFRVEKTVKAVTWWCIEADSLDQAQQMVDSDNFEETHQDDFYDEFSPEWAIEEITE